MKVSVRNLRESTHVCRAEVGLMQCWLNRNSYDTHTSISCHLDNYHNYIHMR